jgi:hypothetical protein
MLLGPPKSKAGRRVVDIPDAIIPALTEHLSVFVKAEPTGSDLRLRGGAGDGNRTRTVSLGS